MNNHVWKDTQNPSGPVRVKDLLITVNRGLCIGTTQCIETAGKTFALDDEGVSSILATADEEEENSIIEAAQGCPMNAITITTKEGKSIYPS